MSRWHAAQRAPGEPSVERADGNGKRPQLPARYGQNEWAIALNRKNALFAGHDRGAANWAVIASLVESCKLNGVDPEAYLADMLTSLVGGWPNRQLAELTPWAWAQRHASPSMARAA